MSEDDLSMQPAAGERERVPGYVKNKIKSSKNSTSVTRARKGEKSQVSTYVAKVYKKAAQLADLMTGEDVEDDLRVLREAKNAVHYIYDQKQRRLVPVPDHKTRLAATTLSRAYHEGKPVERQQVLKGDFKDFPDLIDRLNSSAAFRESYASLQKPVDCKEVTPALPPHDAATG
jgi:hypothetical protein